VSGHGTLSATAGALQHTDGFEFAHCTACLPEFENAAVVNGVVRCTGWASARNRRLELGREYRIGPLQELKRTSTHMALDLVEINPSSLRDIVKIWQGVRKASKVGAQCRSQRDCGWNGCGYEDADT